MTDKSDFTQKVILLILGAFLGAFLKGFTDWILQEDNQDAALQLSREKFKSDLILQSLSSESLEQGLKNLDFIIQADLIDDPEGKIKAAAQKYQPKIESLGSSSNSPVGSISSLEYRGFQALLEKNLQDAKSLFQSAYELYPTYHNVDEINKLIKDKEKINDWNMEIYCPILKKYYWGMPYELKQQMSQNQCK